MYQIISSSEPTCIFSTKNLTTQTIESFPKTCTTVCSDIAIDEHCTLTEDQLASTFMNMKHLVGSLIVISTKYTSLKFLVPLESIECGDYEIMIVLNPKLIELGMSKLTTIKCSSISISNNKAMTKLNIPNLKNISASEFSESNDTRVDLRIIYLDKNFCITTQEMYNFMSSEDLHMDNLFGMHCEPAVPLTNGKVCNSSYTLVYPTNILDDCTQYFGSLVILPENEKEVAKLKSVEMVFGPLYIARTNLTNIDFLGSLKYVSSLGYDTPPIKVENNRLLTNFTFPSLKRIKSSILSSWVVFENNSESLTLNPEFCSELQDQLSVNYSKFNSPWFDKHTCGR
uniref:Recep_L_domain domain-containing protein n=1 Tax=Caenorhabditis tropicalis TaxID=1561998 RepID=A0A1I7T1L9_9PELO